MSGHGVVWDCYLIFIYVKKLSPQWLNFFFGDEVITYMVIASFFLIFFFKNKSEY